MKKVTRYTVYVLLIIIALLGIITLLFPLLIPTEKIKSLLTEELGRQLQRSVFIKSLEIRLLPAPQLVAKNIIIVDTEGFSAQPFLSAKAVKIRVKLFPLLQKKIIMESFILDHPQVKLEKNSRGHWNWESWAPPRRHGQEEREAGGRGKEDSEAAPVIFGFLSMKVLEGEMVLRDETQTSSPILNIRHINVDSRGHWRGQEGKFKFKAEGRIQEGILLIKGELLIPRGQRQPDIDLNYELKNLKLTDISPFLNYLSWPPYLTAQGTLSGKGRAQGRMGKWEYQAEMKLAEGEAYWERPEGKLKLRGDSSFNFTEDKKEGQKISALLSLREASWSYPWEGKSKEKNKEGKLQFKNVRGTLDYSRQRLELNKAEFDFYGGKGKGTFLWRNEKAGGKMNLEMEIQEANLEELLTSAFPPQSPVQGVIDLSLRVQGEGNSWRDLQKTAQGQGDILINNFEVKDSDIKDPLGSIFLALIGGSSAERDKKPSTFKGKFFISEGRVVSDDINLSALGYSAEAKGSYDLLDDTLSLTGYVKSGAQKINFQLKGLLSKLHWNFKMGQVDLKFDLGKSKKKKKKPTDK